MDVLYKYGKAIHIVINLSLLVKLELSAKFDSMYERKIPVTLNCGLDLIGEVLYGKWKIRLLYFINEGYKRPSELQRKIPDAAHRVLFLQLKELEEHTLISKVIYPQVPPKVEYCLTEFGQTLIPLISALGKWGDEHSEHLRKVILKTRS